MATKKIVKKSVKKVVKKAVKKPATKKAKSIKVIQSVREGFKAGTKKNPLAHVRYSNCSISDIGNDKFPEMVQITLGPAKYKHMLGKKFVSLTYAMTAIDEAQAYSLIGKGKKSIEKELDSIGLLPMVDVSGPGIMTDIEVSLED